MKYLDELLGKQTMVKSVACRAYIMQRFVRTGSLSADEQRVKVLALEYQTKRRKWTETEKNLKKRNNALKKQGLPTPQKQNK